MPLKGAKRVVAAMDETVDETNRKLKAVVIGIYSNVIETTPVLDGFARNSWYLTTSGSPSKTVGKSPNKQGAASLSRLESGLPDSILGKQIMLTNNLPYINALEYGTSKQAPRHFVRDAIREGRKALK